MVNFDLHLKNRIFLTAEWRDLAMQNYPVNPDYLKSLVPAGTELDEWQGKVFVSLVGFRFLNTRVWGVRVPFHCNFEEVNLRFYVRRYSDGEWRRGVVFILEIVPRRAIAIVANAFYNEKYKALPMHHKTERRDKGVEVHYGWRSGHNENQLEISASGEAIVPSSASEAHFITEHFWGYTATNGARPVEYRVDHPSWTVQHANHAQLAGDTSHLYGPELGRVLQGEPYSAFLASGSAVTVYRGNSI